MKQTKLDESAKCTVILASYGMASEALDIPTLNTLIMVTPRRNIEQSVGRILRAKTEIDPLIIDIVDQLPSFNNQGMARRKFYKKLRYNMKLFNVNENEIVSEQDLNNDPSDSCVINEDNVGDLFLD